MIGLTLIIAFSVVAQAIYSRKQADLFAKAEARNREREQPKIRFTNASSGFSEGQDANGNPQHKRFCGFILANVGHVDTTITAVDFEVGVPIDSPANCSQVPAQYLFFSPVHEYRGSRLSDSLPQRLRHGETMRVLYDEDELLARIEKRGNGQPSAVLPVCHDSLGNKHTADTWTVWGKNSLGGRHGPGPGFIAWDEWWAERRKTKREPRVTNPRACPG